MISRQVVVGAGLALVLLGQACAAAGPLGTQARLRPVTRRSFFGLAERSGAAVASPRERDPVAAARRPVTGPTAAEASPGVAAAASAAETPRAGGPAPAPAVTHTVAAGETLWRIAERYAVSAEILARHNRLEDPTRVLAGQRLEIPRPGAAARDRAGAGLAPAPPSPGATPAAPARASPQTGLRRDAATRAAPKGEAPSPPPPAPVPRTRVPSARRGYPLVWPAEGAVTSRFGQRFGRLHDGIDIGAAPGAPVRAAAAGEVLFAGEHGSYGHLVVIAHAEGLVTVYAHNALNLVAKGQKVGAGQLIAKVGQTGRATGPHLHFEVRKGARPENPLRFLPP